MGAAEARRQEQASPSTVSWPVRRPTGKPAVFLPTVPMTLDEDLSASDGAATCEQARSTASGQSAIVCGPVFGGPMTHLPNSPRRSSPTSITACNTWRSPLSRSTCLHISPVPSCGRRPDFRLSSIHLVISSSGSASASNSRSSFSVPTRERSKEPYSSPTSSSSLNGSLSDQFSERG